MIAMPHSATEPVTSQPPAGPQPAPLLLDGIAAERLTGGTWVGRWRSVEMRGAEVDHRQVRGGALFACLKGARADGHDFAAAAVGAGAALVLATRAVAAPVPVLVVGDVPRALARLAAELRRRLDAMPTGGAPRRWIGVGGANGKTTTKELLAAAGRGAGRRVHATRGNLNNHLGVPLTIMRTPAEAELCVIELGANHQGEIADLAAIARPEVGAVTNFGPEHLEGFGGLDGVAKGESELFAALPAGGAGFLGLGGMALHAQAHGCTREVLIAIARRYARGRNLALIDDPEAPCAGALPITGATTDDGIRLDTDAGSAAIALLGAHNLANATLAYHAAVAAGCDPAGVLQGLARMAPVAGRLVPRRLGAHLVLDDTYNANPGSVLAGLDVLARRSGNRIAVLGAMGELGEESAAGHRRVGAEAARLGLPLVVVGPAAAAIADGYRAAGGGAPLAIAADRTSAAAEIIRRLADGPHTVLVKASRSAGLEVVVRLIEEAQGR